MLISKSGNETIQKIVPSPSLSLSALVANAFKLKIVVHVFPRISQILKSQIHISASRKK